MRSATANGGAPTSASAGESAPVKITIPGLEIVSMTLTLVGDSPLIVHRFSEKARKMMRDKQTGAATQKKAAKDIFLDYCESMYWLSPMPESPTEDDVARATFGFPTIAFKAAAADAALRGADLKKTDVLASFHIPGEFLRIIGKPTMREDVARVGMGTADLRHRGQFFPWSVEVPVRFNRRMITAEQVVNLFNIAGFSTGVGEWRPQKKGSYGMFHVEVA